jgi:hypothetical protein
MHGMREWNLLPTSLMTGFGVYFSAKYRFRILDKTSRAATKPGLFNIITTQSISIYDRQSGIQKGRKESGLAGLGGNESLDRGWQLDARNW